MSNLFQNLEMQAFRAGITPKTKESIAWFRKKARQLGKISGGKIMQDELLSLKDRPNKSPFGNMYMFFYDPKHKKTLPYYDRFPLIIMLGPAKGGFMGLNLHYLHPVTRAKALDAFIGGGGVPGKYVKAAQKHYLHPHVRSRFAMVEEPEWEIATFLPTAQWEKKGANYIYGETRRKM